MNGIVPNIPMMVLSVLLYLYMISVLVVDALVRRDQRKTIIEETDQGEEE